ncbi:MAG: ATP-binding cassette domain-containing protein [Negativicutes bacterium]|nr:ATP-binding cassette domain-containing protein [Negativicutes bacterium]
MRYLGYTRPSVTKAFYQKKDVLHDLSIDAYAREIIAITRRNGMENTTLAKILCGLYKPNKGIVRLAGNAMNQKPWMKQIRFISHDTASGLFAESVREELLLMVDKTEARFKMLMSCFAHSASMNIRTGVPPRFRADRSKGWYWRSH